MSFYNLYSFVTAKLFYDVADTFFVLIINYFSPILGVNTMWYLHIHFVCAKLFAFLAIKITFPFVTNWLEQPYYNGKVIFLYNSLLHHPHSRWFCVSHTFVSLLRNYGALNRLKPHKKTSSYHSFERTKSLLRVTTILHNAFTSTTSIGIL